MRTRIRFHLAAACFGAVVCISGSAAAQSGETANDLLRFCKAAFDDQSREYFNAGLCFGFIDGVMQYEDLLALVSERKTVFCVPGNVTLGQVARVWIKWLESNPDQLHYPAVLTFTDAIFDAFPCS